MEDFEVKEGDETSECRFYSLLSTVSLLVSLSSLIHIKRLYWI